MKYRHTGYLGNNTRELLNHLIDLYGNIKQNDLDRNKERMAIEIFTLQPMNVYFKQADDATQYALDRNIAYNTGKILHTMLHLIMSTGD